MDPKQMKLAAIVSFVICAVCLFVAFERYNSNADAVRAMKQLQSSSPLGGMFQNLQPSTPAAAKYALFFAVISGVAGGILLVKAGPSPSPQPSSPRTRRTSESEPNS